MGKYVYTLNEWVNSANSLRLNESFDPENGNIILYTTSKNASFEKVFFNRELKFANNAGNMYGLGLYCNLELPEQSGIKYNSSTQSNVYGDNTYKFELESNKLFYIYYDYFKKSMLYEALGEPSKQDFIRAQFQYFGVKVPSESKLISMTPVEEGDATYTKHTKNLQGQCAFNFYKYMNELYYQSENGTLDSPIVGFAYLGANDGKVAVIWKPYELKLKEKRIGRDGEFKKVNGTLKPEVGANDPESLIFDGNKTPEKEQIYRDLVAYKGEDTPLGQFTDIVIYDDKTIDATFKGNTPEFEGGRHVLTMCENIYLKRIIDAGYRFNKLDCWIKFGVSSENSKVKMYRPSNMPYEYLPKEITGGVIFSNIKESLHKNFRYLSELDITTNNEVVLEKCYIETTKFRGYNVVSMDGCTMADDIFAWFKKHNYNALLGSDGELCNFSESQQNELIKYVEKNSQMSEAIKKDYCKKWGLSMKSFMKLYSSDAVKSARK